MLCCVVLCCVYLACDDVKLGVTGVGRDGDIQYITLVPA